MDGPAVFKLAVGVLESVARSVLGQGRPDRGRHRLADPAPGQHPHHAGHGQEAEAAARTSWSSPSTEHGNTSAASIPLALDDAVRDGKIKRGDTRDARRRRRRLHLGRGAARLLRPRLDEPTRSHDSVRIRLSRPGLAVRRHARRLGRPPRGARRRSTRPSAALGEDIGRLIREGPKEQLDLTTNTQPVMLAAGVACYRAWLAERGAAPGGRGRPLARRVHARWSPPAR